MRPGPPSDGSLTRQNPPLWSATHVRPAGSTSAPAATCRPSVCRAAPAACASCAAPAKTSAAPNAAHIFVSGEPDRNESFMWLVLGVDDTRSESRDGEPPHSALP